MDIAPRPLDAGASNPITLINNTITGNTAGTADGQGLGGGIFFDTSFAPGGDAPADFINNTIAGNRALGDDGQGGGLYITTASGEIPSVLNTIIANNRAAAGKDCHDHPVSNGYNLERHKSCDFSTASDQQNTDPKLKPLANNGGPTKTMAIGKGSPAKNKGADIGCPSEDQRGVHAPPGPPLRRGRLRAEDPLGGEPARGSPATSTAAFRRPLHRPRRHRLQAPAASTAGLAPRP